MEDGEYMFNTSNWNSQIQPVSKSVPLQLTLHGLKFEERKVAFLEIEIPDQLAQATRLLKLRHVRVV